MAGEMDPVTLKAHKTDCILPAQDATLTASVLNVKKHQVVSIKRVLNAYISKITDCEATALRHGIIRLLNT